MAPTTPSVVDSYPASGATGIPIGDSVTITFDQEMDEESINTGTFVLAAPDRSVVFGENFSPLDEPGFDDEDILSSPYYSGYVKGTVTFKRINASGGVVDDNETDYTGNGKLWRTVAIFTPTSHLIPNKQYTALLAGDEDPTNAFDSGVTTRTVFDPKAISVSGTGVLNVRGGYTGNTTRTYVLQVDSGGQTGNATYEWWDKSDPLTVYRGVTTTGKRELEDGVYVTFGNDGSFTTGDKWEFVVVPALTLSNTYKWTFTTGSGSIIEPPSTSSASAITTLTSPTTTTSSFVVSEITPDERKYGVATTTTTITVEFTSGTTIDASTLVNNISLTSEVANGDTSLSYTGDLSFTYSVSGNVLTITLDADQLYQNNIVTLILDKDIADTNGNTLLTDYTSYFSTSYSPLYSSLRRIQLDIGTLLTDVSEETIMFAIWEASLHADALSFVANTENTEYYKRARKEYVTCLAELILVRALLLGGGGTDRLSKTLGDLSVSRSGDTSLRDTKDELQNCVAYWQVPVETGGTVSPDGSLPPDWSVKGANSEDAIFVSRQWEPTSGIGAGLGRGIPAANTKVNKYNTRYRTTSRKGFRTGRKSIYGDKN